MPTVSRLNQEEYLEVAQPDEDIMFNPEGRSRNGLRYEFAPSNVVSASDRYVTKGNAPFVHPDSDFAYGDSGLGESVGNVDIVIEEGEPRELFRATHGFTVNMEDEQVDEGWIAENRDAILSFFDAQADIGFLNGVDDGKSGSELRKGMLKWLDDNATDVIDAGSYGVDTDLNGVPANIIANEAYASTTGEYVNESWMDAVAPHDVWSNWNQIGNNDGSGQQSQWSSLANNEAGVGVEGRISLPEFITPARTPPSMDGDLRVDIDFPTASNGDDDDVMWLLPDHGGDFVQLYEMSSPVTHEVEKESFQRRVEYLWRYGQVYDNSFKASSGAGTDIVKIENVSTLFN